MRKYEIYIGLSHKDNESILIDKYLFTKELENAFKDNKIPFSYSYINGGYISNDGRYIKEDSVKITLINELKKDKLHFFINTIKEIYHQETVLLVVSDTDTKYI